MYNRTLCDMVSSTWDSWVKVSKGKNRKVNDKRAHITLFGLDVVAREQAGAVADGALPPLALPLAHQDDIALLERQVVRLGRLVGEQRHVL